MNWIFGGLCLFLFLGLGLDLTFIFVGVPDVPSFLFLSILDTKQESHTKSSSIWKLIGHDGFEFFPPNFYIFHINFSITSLLLKRIQKAWFIDVANAGK